MLSHARIVIYMGLCASAPDRARKRSLHQSETQEQVEVHTYDSRGSMPTTVISTARDARTREEQVTDDKRGSMSNLRSYLRGPDGPRTSAYQRHVLRHGNQNLSLQLLDDCFELAREMDRELMARA